jgi:hypothetical protein
MGATVSDRECQVLLLHGEGLSSEAADLIVKVCDDLQMPVCKCDDQIISTSCVSRIETELTSNSLEPRRQRLLIAGSYFEEQITVCALHTLALGFEVFILKDFVVARDPGHFHAFDMRLFQAGVVPTTLRQLIYEWLSFEDVQGRQLIKRKLLELIDAHVMRPA